MRNINYSHINPTHPKIPSSINSNHYETEYDSQDSIPLDPLNIRNRVNKLRNSSNKQKHQKLYWWYVINTIIILLILGCNIVGLIYLSTIAQSLEKFHLQDINTTDAKEYLNKTKTIINYICTNVIKC